MRGSQLAILLLLVPLAARAQSPCSSKWAKIPALKAVEPWRAKAASADDVKAWDGWSSDLLLHLALVLRQEVIPHCASESAPLNSLADGLEAAYLGKLDLADLPASERPTAFRAFLATREDHPALVEKLKESSGTALERAKHVYGWSAIFRGTAVVASRTVPVEGLGALIKELCPRADCLFWDPTFVYKMLVTDHGGLAAYVPETASLVVSRSLLESLAPLPRLILIHELAHGAIRRAQARGQAWDETFAAFSGWSTKGLEPVVWAPARGDALSKMKVDGFSLDPDPVIGAMAAGKNKFEGFPLGRTPTRVAGSGDFSEDLADSTAAYVVAPERFCFDGKPIAPGKYRFVSEKLFGMKRTLKCAKAPNKRRKK